MRFPLLTSPEDVAALVGEIGFLPFFSCGIEGFSVEECTPRELWFSEGVDGPWEWKGPVARTRTCVYGKFYRGKAGYVSREWFPDFANYRRDGYDFEGYYEMGFAGRADKEIYDAVAESEGILTRTLKQRLDYRKGGKTGFDTAVTRLQAHTFLSISDFQYMLDAHGVPYGWGMAVYDLPERLLNLEPAYEEEPAASRSRMLAHLKKLLPEASEKQLDALIG